MAAAAVDVVLVPDFSGGAARTFELRTLLFLASWLEHAGEARAWPLHLACIGAPPPSVGALAARAGASVTVHEPVHPGIPFLNKMRGLEIAARAESFVLLDADLVVLGDPSWFAGRPRCLGARQGSQPRVSQAQWDRIYAALRLAPPAGRAAWFEPASDALPPRPGRRTEGYPYYNSGVVLAPWDAGLRALWQDHVLAAAAVFRDDEPHVDGVRHSDQVGFALAVEVLTRGGLPFVTLPVPCHAHRFHLALGAVRLDEVALLHAVSLFRGVDAADGIAPELARFARACYRPKLQRLLPGDAFPPPGSDGRPPQAGDADVLHERLARLVDEHVRPALRRS